MTLALAPALTIEQDAPTRDARHHSAGAWREVADWLTFLELEGKAPRTVYDYELTWAALLRTNPKPRMSDYTTADFSNHLTSYPPASRRIRRAHLASGCEWAYLEGLTEKNLLDRVPKQKRGKQKIIQVFSDAEIEALTGLPSPNGTLFQILLDTGLRKGEARRLQVQHAIFDAAPQPRDDDTPAELGPELERALADLGLEVRPIRKHAGPIHKLTIFGGKGDKDRIIPFGPVLAQRIADLLILEGLDREDYFWWCKVGKDVKHDREIGECSFHAWYGKCIKLAGVEYRKPHTTRHTFATRWLRRGGGMVTLSRAMGHASIQTTINEYGHLDVSDIAADLLVVEGVGG
jgi:integrase